MVFLRCRDIIPLLITNRLTLGYLSVSGFEATADPEVSKDEWWETAKCRFAHEFGWNRPRVQATPKCEEFGYAENCASKTEEFL
jgi:hypothetical protein